MTALHTRHRYGIFAVPVLLLIALPAFSQRIFAQQPAVATTFSLPLGFADGYGYEPRPKETATYLTTRSLNLETRGIAVVGCV
jgi:hypothetical protein